MSNFFHLNFTIFHYYYSRGDRLKKWIAVLFFSLIFVVQGCSKEPFQPINQHQSFVASVNILEPSIVYLDSKGEEIATWRFDKAYTGATLIPYDRILLYGHQLHEVDIYELSTGKKIKSIETGIGTTNAYYDKEAHRFFLSNSEKNTVTSFDDKGKKLGELSLVNYPLSMAGYQGKLYVVNYKAPVLSVIDMETMTLLEEWPIDKSSSGLLIVEETNSLWVGGHGTGSRPNQTVKVLDLESGKLTKEIQVSIMPVGFSKCGDEVYVTNHGSNELFACNVNGDVLWNVEVGANPFAVEHFNEKVVVAGFDDHKIYFIFEGEILNMIETDHGPFQLLVREV